LEQHRFSGAGGSYDERALPVSDRRDEIDGAPRQLGSTLRGSTRFQLEFSLRIRGDERSEIRTAQRKCGIRSIYLRDLSDDSASPMIASRSCENCIAATKSILSREIGLHVCVGWIGEIAIRGASNESSFALRIIPACCLTVGNDRSHRLARSLIALLLLWSVVVSSASARIALIAASVVAVVAAVVLRTSVSAVLLWTILLVGVALLLWLLLLVLLRCRLVCVGWGGLV